MPQWYIKILLVRVVTGNTFKFRGNLVKSLILTYYGNIIRVIANYYQSKKLENVR